MNNTITREKMIEALIARDTNSLEEGGLLFGELMATGFKGYYNFSDKELEEVYNDGLEEKEKISIK